MSKGKKCHDMGYPRTLLLSFGRHSVFEGLRKLFAEIDFQNVITGDDHGFDIRVNQRFGNDKLLPEDIQLPVAADEPNEDDVPLREVIDARHPRIGRHLHGPVVGSLEDLHRCFALQAAVTVMAVVEPLEVLALSLEGLVARKPLPAKERFVVGIVESLHVPVAPRLADGDEHRCHPVMEAHPDDDPEGSRITVAAPEAQFVVELDEIRDAQGLPAAEEAGSHRLIGLGSLRLEIDLMAEEVHHVERVEPAIALDVPGPHQVHLVDVVDL